MFYKEMLIIIPIFPVTFLIWRTGYSVCLSTISSPTYSLSDPITLFRLEIVYGTYSNSADLFQTPQNAASDKFFYANCNKNKNINKKPLKSEMTVRNVWTSPPAKIG